MKKAIVCLFVAVGVISSVQATVTLTFSAVNTGALTSLADSASSTANGLVWGIVVDSAGNGFQTASYTAGWTLNTNTAGILMPGALDDVLYITGVKTANSLGTGGAVGSAIQAAGLTLNTALGVQGAGTTLATVNGDNFAIIWFDRTTLLGGQVADGSKYGLYENAAFKMPGDGASVPYNTLFTSVDPVRPTELTIGTIIPEPSAALLGALGVLGLLRRRRI